MVGQRRELRFDGFLPLLELLEFALVGFVHTSPVASDGSSLCLSRLPGNYKQPLASLEIDKPAALSV
jgi:hypothetical protein